MASGISKHGPKKPPWGHTAELEGLLQRAALLGVASGTPRVHWISFESMLLAFLVIEWDDTCTWFQGYVERSRIPLDTILATRKLDREKLRQRAEKRMGAEFLKRFDPSGRVVFNSAIELMKMIRHYENACLHTTDLLAAYIYRPGKYARLLNQWGFNLRDLSDAYISKLKSEPPPPDGFKYYDFEMLNHLHRLVFRSESVSASAQRPMLPQPGPYDELPEAPPRTIDGVPPDIHRYEGKEAMSTTSFPKLFLAHAREDKGNVRKLYDQLKSQGFDPWLDEVDIMPGQNWRVEIPKAIRKADMFIACLSTTSVEKQGYVQKEFRLALDTFAEKPAGSIYLIPVRLDDCRVPDLQTPQLGLDLKDIQWVDLFQPHGFERLVEAVRSQGRKTKQPH